MVQFSTDASGNVAMFTKANRLCFQARGANSVSCGIEHMHATIDAIEIAGGIFDALP